MADSALKVQDQSPDVEMIEEGGAAAPNTSGSDQKAVTSEQEQNQTANEGIENERVVKKEEDDKIEETE